jgi:hypothetical protein
MRITRRVAVLAATALGTSVLAATAAGTGVSQASVTLAACQGPWQLAPVSPQVSASYEEFIQTKPDVLSSKDVWLGATVLDESNATFGSVVLHWNGTSVTEAPAIPPLPSQVAADMEVDAMSFDSDSDGWVLGEYQDGWGIEFSDHWHDGQWTLTPLPPPPDPATTGIQLHGVDSLSPDNAWAVGGIYQGGPGEEFGIDPIGALIEHWDGTQWSQVPNPAAAQPNTVLNGLTVVSPSDIWAAGYQGDSAGNQYPLIEHWDGSTWSEVPVPTGNEPSALYAISGDSAGDVWAVGAQTETGTSNTAVALAEHWNGSGWTTVTNLPGLGNTYLGSVYAASPSDVWATTYGSGAGASSSTFAHWNGTSWTTTTAPGPPAVGLGYLYGGFGEGGGVSGSGPGDVWASGQVIVTGQSNETAPPQLARLACGDEGN